MTPDINDIVTTAKQLQRSLAVIEGMIDNLPAEGERRLRDNLSIALIPLRVALEYYNKAYPQYIVMLNSQFTIHN